MGRMGSLPGTEPTFVDRRVVGAILAMPKHAMEIPAVVARPLITVVCPFGIQPRVLGVLFSLVMLLPIFHQSPATRHGVLLPVVLDTIVARLLMLPLVKLLDEAAMRLASVLPFRVCLGTFLLRARRVFRVADFFLSLRRWLVFLVVLPVAHRCFLAGE